MNWAHKEIFGWLGNLPKFSRCNCHSMVATGPWKGENSEFGVIWGPESGGWVHRFLFPAPVSEKVNCEMGKCLGDGCSPVIDKTDVSGGALLASTLGQPSKEKDRQEARWPAACCPGTPPSHLLPWPADPFFLFTSAKEESLPLNRPGKMKAKLPKLCRW